MQEELQALIDANVPVLSIRQPWAHAIIFCGKDVENRSWSSDYRGPLLIHAGKQTDPDMTPWALAAAYSVDVPDNLPRGGIVGVVDMVDCVERHRSRWFYGPYGFVLKNPRPLVFHKCLGQLRFFRLKAPKENSNNEKGTTPVDNNLLKKATPTLTDKAGNMAKNIVDSNMPRILKQLKSVCDESPDGDGMVPIELRIPVSFEGGKFGVKASLKCAPKREKVTDSLGKVEIDPNQPDLPLDDGNGGDEDGEDS